MRNQSQQLPYGVIIRKGSGSRNEYWSQCFREAYLLIEGTDLNTEANQEVPLSLVGIILLNQSPPDLRSLKSRHERAQDQALDEQGKARELYEEGNLSVILVRSYRHKD